MLRELWLKWGGNALDTTPRRQGWLIALLMIGGAILCLSVGNITLAPGEQAYISIGTVTLFFILNRRPGRHVTCILMMLSLFVSFRYLIWRLGRTVEFHGPLQVAMSLALLAAEGYALSTLCLSYFQMSWPLGRKPHCLPDNPDDWPVVDVYVPSYNEDLELVRSTVLGAMDLHWPADKLNVYILDDGRRKASGTLRSNPVPATSSAMKTITRRRVTSTMPCGLPRGSSWSSLTVTMCPRAPF